MKCFYFTVDEEGDSGYVSFCDSPDSCAFLSRPALVGELSVESMVEALDQDAESLNCHAFVGLHRVLAVLIASAFGREAAFGRLLLVSRFGGLHGLKEKYRQGEAVELLFDEHFGVKLDWSDWVLPE